MREFPSSYPRHGDDFLGACKEFLEEIERRERGHFELAGKMIADKVLAEEVVYVVGCGGHSWVPPMDMFCRAGGLVQVSALMDVSTSTLTGGFKSVITERVPGYMNALFAYHRIAKDDLVIIFNNVGVNALTIDAALECRRLGAQSIGVSGSPWQEALPPDSPVRHPTGENLKDLVDLFIDDYNPVGDCVLLLPGMDTPIAPISTITDGYIVRRIEIEAMKAILAEGATPPVWVSANNPDGDARNEQYLRKYFYRIKLF